MTEEEINMFATILRAKATHNKELEAKLAKAVDFLRRVIRHAGNCGDDYLAEKARTTLAELKGETDE